MTSGSHIYLLSVLISFDAIVLEPDVVIPSRPAPSSTRFPYTTLFRSRTPEAGAAGRDSAAQRDAEVVDEAASAARRPVKRAYREDRKSTRLNSSHVKISYAVFCLKKKKKTTCSVASTDCCTDG